MSLPEPVKRSASRNRNAGHKYERDMAEEFRKNGFPHTVTSRSENRARDGQKVDLCNRDEYKNGRLPYNIQCKCEARPVPYERILSEMPNGNEINVVLHRLTYKTKGGIFKTKGEFAILSQEDFLTLIAALAEKAPNDSTC